MTVAPVVSETHRFTPNNLVASVLKQGSKLVGWWLMQHKLYWIFDSMIMYFPHR